MKTLLKCLVLIWMSKTFYTVGGLTSFLNTLPVERQMEAKVVVSDFNAPMYLLYREEK